MIYTLKRKNNRLDSLSKQFKNCLTSLLLFTLFLTPAYHLDAQVRLQDPAERETPFIENLWFGGNVNLGFQGSNNYNLFFFGLSPMVGYKITDNFSVGPRVEVLYTYYKAFVFNENRNRKANVFSYSGGAFVRQKFLNQFFAHGEYNRERATFPIRDFAGNFYSENGRLATRSLNFDNLFIGLGYFSGGKLGSEIVILYNVLEAEETLTLPISIRVGLNYNF